MRQLTLEEIKKIEFDILVVFKKFCEKNHLYYTLAGGTLLGAIRHKGFIPWDDDIDTLMPRKDFDRILNNEDLDFSMIPDYIKISSWRSVKGEPFPFIKILDTRTKVVDKYSHADQHVWIDVFPMDGCTDNNKELKSYYKKILFFRRILLLRNAKIGEGKTLIKKFIKPMVTIPLRLFSRKYLCEKYNEYSKKYSFENSEYVAGVVWGYGPQERVDKKGFLNPVDVVFEGELFNAPSNYKEYLKGLYNNYMELPPESLRMTRHDIKVYIEDN